MVLKVKLMIVMVVVVVDEQQMWWCLRLALPLTCLSEEAEVEAVKSCLFDAH